MLFQIIKNTTRQRPNVFSSTVYLNKLFQNTKLRNLKIAWFEGLPLFNFKSLTKSMFPLTLLLWPEILVCGNEFKFFLREIIKL